MGPKVAATRTGVKSDQVRLRAGQVDELATLRDFLPNLGTNQECTRAAMDAFIAACWREVDRKNRVLGQDDADGDSAQG